MKRWQNGFRIIGVFFAIALMFVFVSSALAERLVSTCGATKPLSTENAHCLSLRILPSLKNNLSKDASIAKNKKPPTTELLPIRGAYSPQELESAYGVPATTTESATQTVAVVDAYNYPRASQDLEVFSKQYNLPLCTTKNGCLKIVNQNGKTSPLPKNEPGWAQETALDLDMVHGICQNCHIILVEGFSENNKDLAESVNAAVKLGATEVSNSYGYSESEKLIWIAKDYNHPGVVITAAAGDDGYLDWQEVLKSGGGEPESADFPATSPDVVAVGGTTLTKEINGSWHNTVWSGTGGGCSKLFHAPKWQLELADYPHHRCHDKRIVSDVAATADPQYGVSSYDSIYGGEGAPAGWDDIGGTSAASPIVAAMFALAGGAHGVPYPAQVLYEHLDEPSALYNVISGNNSTSCEVIILHISGCIKANLLCQGLFCNAEHGYNSPTGVGSPTSLKAFLKNGQPLPFAPVNTETPKLSTTYTEIGTPVSVTAGNWSDTVEAAYSYQWYDCYYKEKACTAIPGATLSSYTPQENDLNGHIYATVTATNPWGTATATSNSSEYTYWPR